MKRLFSIITLWLIASCASWADDQHGRFLEFKNASSTRTFDLNTVQLIEPGRFTIVETAIDDPDVMKFELKAINTMRSYCARPDGQYPAPPELMTLGSSDMPVKNITVKSSQHTKAVTWSYPYRRLASGSTEEFSYFLCDRPLELDEMRNLLFNGLQQKYLYDCKRGLEGLFMNVEDDPKMAITFFVTKGTWAFEFYRSVCRAVTHEAPYVPK